MPFHIIKHYHTITAYINMLFSYEIVGLYLAHRRELKASVTFLEIRGIVTGLLLFSGYMDWITTCFNKTYFDQTL